MEHIYIMWYCSDTTDSFLIGMAGRGLRRPWRAAGLGFRLLLVGGVLPNADTGRPCHLPPTPRADLEKDEDV